MLRVTICLLKKCYLRSWDVELGGSVFSLEEEDGNFSCCPISNSVCPPRLSQNIDPSGGDLVRLSAAPSSVLGWLCSRLLYFFFLFNWIVENTQWLRILKRWQMLMAKNSTGSYKYSAEVRSYQSWFGKQGDQLAGFRKTTSPIPTIS